MLRAGQVFGICHDTSPLEQRIKEREPCAVRCLYCSKSSEVCPQFRGCRSPTSSLSSCPERRMKTRGWQCKGSDVPEHHIVLDLASSPCSARPRPERLSRRLSSHKQPNTTESDTPARVSNHSRLSGAHSTTTRTIIRAMTRLDQVILPHRASPTRARRA
jgi:hypothetical protein